MPFPGNMPTKVAETLSRLGAERVSDIERIRGYLTEIASLGTPLLPEFTLHNQVHSDNLIRVLVRLKEEFGLKLGRYEAFLLAASAYLHDLGMFFDGEDFREKVLPDPAGVLSFCSHGLCDTVENYHLFGLDTGGQIRETHNLLSAYWLYHHGENPIDGIADNDRPYLITICRGHRKADLRERKCCCYQTMQQDGEEIRIALLAALLRLVDAMDFYSDRAPTGIFRKNAATFLKNPVSLHHWIKHYFVQDPFVVRANEGGNLILKCTVYFSVPTERLNGVRYLDFFRPLFEMEVAEARKWSFNIGEYPHDLTNALGIRDMSLVLAERELPGARDLPDRVIRAIEQTQSRDVLEFLEHRVKKIEQDRTTGLREGVRRREKVHVPLKLPTEPVLIVEDHRWYREQLDSILTEEGYQCEQEETSEEALKKLNRCSPFLILLDLKLGGAFRKGWSIARIAVDKGIPTIIITNYPSVEAVNRAIREYDVVYFFDKSRLSPEALVSKVAEVARSRREKLSRKQRQALFERLMGFFPESEGQV